MEPQEATTTPPWMGCQSNARLPPAFHQASLTVSEYPFVLLEGEGQTYFDYWVKRSTVRVRCLAKELNILTQLDLETRLLITDSSTLTLPPSPLSMLSYFLLATINTQAQIHKLF